MRANAQATGLPLDRLGDEEELEGICMDTNTRRPPYPSFLFPLVVSVPSHCFEFYPTHSLNIPAAEVEGVGQHRAVFDDSQETHAGVQ